jgi:hypothetical protein
MVTFMQIWQFIITTNVLQEEGLKKLEQRLQERNYNVILVIEKQTQNFTEKSLHKIDLMEKKACTNAVLSKKSSIIIYYRSPKLQKKIATKEDSLFYDGIYVTTMYQEFDFLFRHILLNIGVK